MDGQVLRFEGGVGRGRVVWVRRAQPSTKTCPYGHVFVLVCSGGVGRHSDTKHAPKGARVSCQSAVEGREGSRARRTCPHGHVLRDGLQGKGWGMRAAEHEKHATRTCFSCPGRGGGGR